MLSYLSKQHHVTAWLFVTDMTDSMHIKVAVRNRNCCCCCFVSVMLGKVLHEVCSYCSWATYPPQLLSFLFHLFHPSIWTTSSPISRREQLLRDELEAAQRRLLVRISSTIDSVHWVHWLYPTELLHLVNGSCVKIYSTLQSSFYFTAM